MKYWLSIVVSVLFLIWSGVIYAESKKAFKEVEGEQHGEMADDYDKVIQSTEKYDKSASRLHSDLEKICKEKLGQGWHPEKGSATLMGIHAHKSEQNNKDDKWCWPWKYCSTIAVKGICSNGENNKNMHYGPTQDFQEYDKLSYTSAIYRIKVAERVNSEIERAYKYVYGEKMRLKKLREKSREEIRKASGRIPTNEQLRKLKELDGPDEPNVSPKEIITKAYGNMGDERNIPDGLHSKSGFLRDVEYYLWYRTQSAQMSTVERDARRAIFSLSQSGNNFIKATVKLFGMEPPRSNNDNAASEPSPSAKEWAMRGYDDGANDAEMSSGVPFLLSSETFNAVQPTDLVKEPLQLDLAPQPLQ